MKNSLASPRLSRELRTIEKMFELWCAAHHAPGAGGPCGACRELLDYAAARLGNCPYGDEKPACAKCPIHCYKPETREKVREVMRWAGPRMLTRHPWLAVRHLLDGRREAPERKKKG
ncbi:nitrous oxide-stimulated promoter family protein [Anaeromyxobacter paludicola]|nr:nitrous oxide-stimulated promoter family protein [Anaeromyxobacter paludicola]